MAQNNSIRIGQSKKLKIEVNDDGDYIVLDFSDGSFTKRFKDYAKLIETSSKEYLERVKAISLNATTDELNGEETAEADFDFNTTLAKGLDDLLGVGTCRKVFGHDTPSADAISELLEALTPYIVEYRENREKKVSSKYSPNKKGGSK